MLYGPGAGSGPTAASVVSDILNLHAASVKIIIQSIHYYLLISGETVISLDLLK